MKKITLVVLGCFLSWGLQAQIFGTHEELTNREGSQYRFRVIKHLDATPVKNQGRTGTCWSFSSLSFLESELLRMGKPQVNLSEMWIARNAYVGKAVNYLRMDGHTNFGQGGEFHDIPWVMKHYGLVPEEAYPGLAYGEARHNHGELYAVLKAQLEALKKLPQGGKLTPSWKKAFTQTLDAYLGAVPDNTEDFKFKVNGRTFTPKSYAKHLGLNPDNYVSITSFTHHPFYTSFVIEIPDNWSFQTAYNVPVDELLKITEDAIMKGYTVAWGADVSEKGFSHRNGLAIFPEDERTVSDRKSKDLFLKIDGEKVPNAFMQPVKEIEVTQEMRQDAFDRKLTTDDHGMHIVGIAMDQTGKKYFIVKNSWGNTNDLNGYFFVSYPYFKYKTIMVFLNKDALPASLKKKMD